MRFFDPLLAEWFTSTVGPPTASQESVWPLIAQGKNVLLTAPTGSGKTLAAFFYALNQLVVRNWVPEQTHVLYISPLKALNNDIQRNLTEPLQSIRSYFLERERGMPSIRVATRSGDTPVSERRIMLRRPPEILITTPESLNVLLTTASGLQLFRNLKTVILDELHAIAGTKRGVYLMQAVDRLVHIAGDFQRIVLSATIRPVETVARFAAGYILKSSGGDYVERPIEIVQAPQQKTYRLALDYPVPDLENAQDQTVWDRMVELMKPVIHRNRSTLVFVNSRRLCEKLALKLNENEPQMLAYAHHGSLSKELRLSIEQRLKSGCLKAIVATNSLELGIDIGTLDEVILVQSPPTVSAAIQRIGRSGHAVGIPSQAMFLASHPWDLVESHVMLELIKTRNIEQIRLLSNPLDVLAQGIISACATEQLTRDDLFRRIRTTASFHHLERKLFDQVIEMLTGRYEDTKVPELKPRILIDPADHTCRPAPGAVQSLYFSGGTIPDRGYYKLRHQASSAVIGDLDEEFVWESSAGRVFDFGNQSWRIERITQNEVFVSPRSRSGCDIPFWKAEEQSRDYHFSEAILNRLEQLDELINDDRNAGLFPEGSGMTTGASDSMLRYLKLQRCHSGVSLPHRHHILIEYLEHGPADSPGNQIFIHTLWGNRLNRPFSLAIQAAWELRYNHRIEVFTSNDIVALVLPTCVNIEEIIGLVTPSNLESLLRKSLESTGFFGARFRENAQRSLLLSRKRFGERMPLWMSRLRSQKLFNAVISRTDFPVLLETWRTCLRDEFDIEQLLERLREIHDGSIRISQAHLQMPSPFASKIAWRQINDYMYRDDTPASGITSNLEKSFLDLVSSNSALYPAIDTALARQFESKLQYRWPGYSPGTKAELFHMLFERLAVPESEWNNILERMSVERDIPLEELLEETLSKTIRIIRKEPFESLIVLIERRHVIEELLSEKSLSAVSKQDDLSTVSYQWFLKEWMKFAGPVSIGEIHFKSGLPEPFIRKILDRLTETGDFIQGALIKGDQTVRYCHRDHYESLLRQVRRIRRDSVATRPARDLIHLMARLHGISGSSRSITESLERLECLPLRADCWETEIFPARHRDYSPEDLDRLIGDGELIWVGRGLRHLMFCFLSDIDFLKKPESELDPSSVFPDPGARYNPGILASRQGCSLPDLVRRLWALAWAGLVSSDSYQAVRRRIMNPRESADSKPEWLHQLHVPARSRNRIRFDQWKSNRLTTGTWFGIPFLDAPPDALDQEELIRDRIRLLLSRYGILFRDILNRELPEFRWQEIIRSLRWMEFSGELSGGLFFEDIPGLQFASAEFLNLMNSSAQEEDVFWIHSMDPVSPVCFMPHSVLPGMPRPSPGTHLVFCAGNCVMISRNNGRYLNFRTDSEDPRISEYLCVLRHLMTRRVGRRTWIKIEEINGVPAVGSPFLKALEREFEVTAGAKDILIEPGN